MLIGKTATLKSSVSKKIWFLQSVASELIAIYSKKRFYEDMKKAYLFLSQEKIALEINKASLSCHTMVLVGGGILPYTALFHRGDFKKIIVLENRWWIKKLVPAALLKRFKHISILRINGMDFDYPDNALVIISLLTQGKEQIVKRIRSTAKNASICIRLPLSHTHSRYEGFSEKIKGRLSFENSEFGLRSVRLS